MARQLELCLQPSAQRLLSPPVRSWRNLARRIPVTCVLLAAVLPNVCAALFNYFYNRREIIEHLQNSQEAFEQTQTAINAVAFPVGIFFVFWLTRPVAAAIQTAPDRRQPGSSREILSADALRALRRGCLRLGHLAAGISLALWLVAAPVYPLALQLELGSVPLSAHVHFVASLTLCGLIAAVYPFFGVASLSVSSFYPALVRIDSITDEDRLALIRLGRTSGWYLVLAATVPMLSVVILVVIGSQARLALGLLAAAGLAGFGLAFLGYRLLQSDLAALTAIAIPADETVDAPSAL
jgi:hypothetical protein